MTRNLVGGVAAVIALLGGVGSAQTPLGDAHPPLTEQQLGQAAPASSAGQNASGTVCPPDATGNREGCPPSVSGLEVPPPPRPEGLETYQAYQKALMEVHEQARRQSAVDQAMATVRSTGH
jgi:hypothetical protein